MAEKVVLTEDGATSRGGIWVDTAPQGADELTLTVTRKYKATGETIDDKRWGRVRVFKEIAS